MGFISTKHIQTRALALVKREVESAFRDVADRARGVIIRMAGLDGRISEREAETIQAQVGDMVQGMFVSFDGRKSYDGVKPLSRYAKVLNDAYVFAVRESVMVHHRWMVKHIPQDVREFLTRNPRPLKITELTQADERRVRIGMNKRLLDTGNLLSEVEDVPPLDPDIIGKLRIFRPNPMAELDPTRRWVPMHRWQDERGYRLSDRIWEASLRTRMKVDALIADAIRTGNSAENLANRLEQFLLPSRAPLRTNKPYGRDASYDAMRLARTEITRAVNQASFISGYLNPYTSGFDVARSFNGDPQCKICPQHATIDMAGNRVKPPYSYETGMIPPYHPHDKCNIRHVMRDSQETVTNELRTMMDDARKEYLDPIMTPLMVTEFIRLLLGVLADGTS